MSTPTSPAVPDAEAAGLPSRRRVLMIVGGLMAGILLAALDQTIIATSLRTIADDLQGLQVQAWATTAYLITATVTTPLYGKLGDLYGRKNLYLVAITVFVVGSALCALSGSMYELAAFRAIQGIGAGGLFALALAIVGDLVPPRERARYQGLFLAVFGTASVLGPLVGGFLAGSDAILGISGWRWVFLVNLPVGVVALVLVTVTLRIPHSRRDHRLDVAGAAFFVGGLVPVLVVAEQGRSWGWTSPATLGLVAVGVVLLALFVRAEWRAGDDALVPLRLFRSRTIAVGTATSLAVGTAMFGGLAVLPLYLQIVRGLSPTEAGLTLLPLTLGIMATALASGQIIARTGRYRAIPVAGAAVMVVSLVLFAQVAVDTPMWFLWLAMTLFGLGLGGNLQPIVLAMQNAAPPSDIGVATSTVTFARQMGGTLGTAAFLSVLFSTVGDRITEAFRRALDDPAFRAAVEDPALRADPANRAVAEAVTAGLAEGRAPDLTSSVLDDSSLVSALDPRLAEPFQVGFSEAMAVVFWVSAAIMAVGLVVVVFLPELPLRTRSALAERTAAESASPQAEVPAERSSEAAPTGAGARDGRPGAGVVLRAAETDRR